MREVVEGTSAAFFRSVTERAENFATISHFAKNKKFWKGSDATKLLKSEANLQEYLRECEVRQSGEISRIQSFLGK